MEYATSLRCEAMIAHKNEINMDLFAVFSSFFVTKMDKLVLKMLNHPQKVRLVAHLSVVDKCTNNTCSMVMMMMMTMPTFIQHNSINLNAQCSEGCGGRGRERNRESHNN